MNNLGDLVVKAVIYLVVLLVGTFVIGFILNLVAIYIPPAATYIYCPPGTSMQTSWVQTSYDHPGEKSLSGECVSPDGKNYPKLPDSIVTPREYLIFMPMGFAIMLLIFAVRFVMGFVGGRRQSGGAGV